MNRSTLVKLAASSLVLAGTAIGCKPQSDARPMAISSVAPRPADPRNAGRAAQLTLAATRLLAKGKPVQAVARAEQAVAFTPRDAARRTLLGRAYLASGRFVSAEAAFNDALALDPANGAAMLNLALSEVALGKWSEARTTLADAQGHVSEADRGLGLALAGKPDDAVAVLEPAARAIGADAKTRQNLALAYALAGRWAEARAVAAQDVAPADLDMRMAEWARFAQPTAVWEQVATLLKVTPARDPGQPTALALGPVAAPVQTVAADPVPVAELPAAVAAPVRVAAADPGPIAEVPAAPTPLDDAVAAIAPVPASDAAPVMAAAPSPAAVFYAAPANDAPLLHARRPAAKPSLLYRAGFKASAPSFTQSEHGKWAVQLGAYAAPRAMDTAWSRVSGRFTMLAAYTPAHSQRDRFRRLALSGFASHADATALCRRIKARHGDCFVRPTQGDMPVQMVAKTPAVQVASR